MVFFELFSHNPEIVKVSTGTAEVIVNDRVVETLQHGSAIGEVSDWLEPAPPSGVI